MSESWSGAIEPMRILVLGAGVIGSVYARKLLEAGHRVVLLARGRRLIDLQTAGLALENSQTKQRRELTVPVVDRPEPDEHYDLVLVTVRAEQLAATLPVFDGHDRRLRRAVLGNIAGHGAVLIDALGQRAIFGFPAAGGIQDDAVIRYALIGRQKTTIGEPNGTTSRRVQGLQAMFSEAAFPTTISAHVDAWLLGHAAFVVPMAFALYRVDTSAVRLAHDATTLRLMVRATRQAFRALRAFGIAEIPTNLMVLYLRMPERFAVHDWQRILAGPRGELWFAAHSRAAVQEMTSLADHLQAAVHRTGYQAHYLDARLSRQ